MSIRRSLLFAAVLATAALCAAAFAPPLFGWDPTAYHFGVALAAVAVGFSVWALDDITKTAPLFAADSRTAWAFMLNALANSIMTVLRRLGALAGTLRRYAAAPGHSWRYVGSA